MKKNIIILVFVLAALSIAAYSATITRVSTDSVELTDDISLDKREDCITTFWNEEENVYGTCNAYYNHTVCEDEPYNTSCYTEELSSDYKCITGTKTVQKSKETCADRDMRLTVDTLAGTKEYVLEYGEWGRCSYAKEDEDVIITCDSKRDGNNDGKCTPGESCIQFRVTKQGVQKYEKNSRIDFVENDDSFFLERLSMEEVK